MRVCIYCYCLAQILRKLEERGADLDHLQEMQDKDIGVLIRYGPGGRVLLYYLVMKIVISPTYQISDFVSL